MVGSGSTATQAKRVMVGTGSSAVEVWPGMYDVSMDFLFPNEDELKWAPITGFDSRTDATSEHAPSFVFSDMLVAGDNSKLTYHTRLVDQELDQVPVSFQVTLGDVLNTRDVPSYVVLSSNITLTYMLIVEFGSNGFSIYSIVNGVKEPSTPHVYNTPLAPGDVLEIQLVGDRYVYVGRLNGPGTQFSNLTMVSRVRSGPGRMYFGFGLCSDSGKWSTRIQRIQIEGKTTLKRVLAASAYAQRIEIPRNTWTEVARSVVPTGGTTFIALTSGTWNYTSSSEDRLFRIKINGTVMATGTDESGEVFVTNQALPDNAVVTVEAYAATSNSAYRRIEGGILQIGNPLLPT